MLCLVGLGLIFWFGLLCGVALCAAFPPLPVGVRSLVLGLRSRAVTSNLAPQSRQRQDNLAPTTAQSEAMGSRKLGRAVANIARFLWRWKWALLVVAFFFFGVGLLRGCVPSIGDLGKSRGEIALERELAQAETELQEAVNARDAIIAQAAQEAAIHRAQISVLLDQGRQDIEAATPDDETQIDPSLELAWRGALGRLYANAGIDAASPNPGGAGASL